MRCKRGQFFIIAAVILAFVVMSFISVRNNVVISPESEKFYDLTYEINHEASEVIDYGVYSSEDVTTKLKEFTDALSENIKDQDSDISFVFIYGNDTELILENHGGDDGLFQIGDEVGTIVPGAGRETRSKIRLNFGGISTEQSVGGHLGNFKKSYKINAFNSGEARVRITINGEDYEFNIGKSQRFFVIIKKILGDEEYVEF